MLARLLTASAVLQNDILYLLYKLPTVVISRRTDQYSKAHEILTGVAASAAKRPRTAPMLPAAAASVPPPGMLQHHNSMGNADGPKLVHASTAPEGMPKIRSAEQCLLLRIGTCQQMPDARVLYSAAAIFAVFIILPGARKGAGAIKRVRVWVQAPSGTQVVSHWWSMARTSGSGFTCATRPATSSATCLSLTCR